MLPPRVLVPASPAARILLAAALAAAAGLAVVAGQGLWAQVEGERGIAPIASSGDFEVGGISVETTGDDAEDARIKGWKEAQRKGWEKLWQQRNPGIKPPALPDNQLDAMVSAVVIETEQIGPRRYIATLGVIFDRAKAGGLLGLGGEAVRSAPLLVIPVLDSGGATAVFEYRTPWQRAWAEYKTGASAIDYVRPFGGGGELLLLTAGQINRRSRTWWRMILDQFGAADVIMPLARLERQWPGGPVRGTFTARYGPDNLYLDSFTLTVRDEDGLPAMLDQAVVRLNEIYTQGLNAGQLQPDPTLMLQPETDEALIVSLLERSGLAAKPLPVAPAAPSAEAGATTPQPGATAAVIATYTVQYVTPDATSVDTGVASVRGAAGVRGVNPVSIAIGGTSVMMVTFAGDADALRAALQARGWQVSQSGSTLSIRR